MRDDSRSQAPLTKEDLQTILDHVTKERRNVENFIAEKLNEVNERLENIEDRLGRILFDFFAFKVVSLPHQ